jgi:hypothetical protein
LEDVIRVKDQFYVLATSPFADDRTRVLKYGDTFVVLNRFGDIGSAGLGEQGLYHGGTRYLSRFVLRLGGSLAWGGAGIGVRSGRAQRWVRWKSSPGITWKS